MPVQFPAVIQLSDLNGKNGFRLDGINMGDYSGRSVASAGDVNDDGIRDLIIGASRATANCRTGAGKSYVVFVYVDEETQISRLMKRDKLSKELAPFRIKSQIPMEEKKSQADYLIDNRGTEEESERQLDEIIRQIKRE